MEFLAGFKRQFSNLFKTVMFHGLMLRVGHFSGLFAFWLFGLRMESKTFVVDQLTDHLAVMPGVLVLIRLSLHLGFPTPVKRLIAFWRVVKTA